MNQYYEKLMPQCNHCSSSDACSNCIFNININDECPSCNRLIDGDQYQQNLQRQLSMLEDTRPYYPEIMKHYQVN